jgi:hypothetical protein
VYHALVSGVRPHVSVSLLQSRAIFSTSEAIFFFALLAENCFGSADPDLSGHLKVAHLTGATPRMCDYEVYVVFEEGVPEPVEVAAGKRERASERARARENDFGSGSCD